MTIAPSSSKRTRAEAHMATTFALICLLLLLSITSLGLLDSPPEMWTVSSLWAETHLSLLSHLFPLLVIDLRRRVPLAQTKARPTRLVQHPPASLCSASVWIRSILPGLVLGQIIPQGCGLFVSLSLFVQHLDTVAARGSYPQFCDSLCRDSFFSPVSVFFIVSI